MIATHLATTAFAALLIAVSWIDLRTLRIPDWLNLAIGVSGLMVVYMLGRDLAPSLIGIALGYVTLAGVNLAYRTVRGRDGIGMGDAKFLAACGAWVGWSGLPFIVLIASAVGVATIAAARIAGRLVTATDKTPFGPFLAASAMLVWLVQSYG